MFNFQNFIEGLIGGGGRATSGAAKRLPRREPMRAIPRQPRMPRATLQSSTDGGGSYQTPAMRDFPGRTNYGVPEDNMIDTPIGYISPQAYNSLGPIPIGNPAQQTIHPQYQITPGSEGSAIQGKQYGAPIQGGVDPQRKQRNPFGFNW